MVDDTSAASAGSICPWCSARYTGEPDTCPSCGAALAVDPATDPALPGLTAIDAAAIVRAKTPVARPRNRLLSWISGEYPDETPSAVEAGALAPPPVEVRREMLRLELEAEMANLQAEAGALLAEATADGRVTDASVAAVAGPSTTATGDVSVSPPETVASGEAPSADPSNGDGATTPV
jgi:hypothetical protein